MKNQPASPVQIAPTRDWKIADLKPVAYNPREISGRELRKLRTSIARFGLVEDIVVNVNPERYGNIVGGHQKLKILIARGVETIPCKEVNLDEDGERELNFRLNGNGGRFSNELLLANGYDHDELEEWGFRAEDLKAFDKAAGEDDDVANPKKRGETGAQLSGLIYSVIVECGNDEHQQNELLARFREEGLKCKPLIS